MAYLACLAANPAITSTVLVCYSLTHQTPPTTRTVGGRSQHASDGAYIHGVPIFVWVPIFTKT